MKIISNGEVAEIPASGVTMEQVEEAIDDKLDAYTPMKVYSTEETRIGTWIDGKPLYRKTIQTTSPDSLDSDISVYNVASLNIDWLVNIYGTIYTSASSMNSIDYPGPNTYTIATYYRISDKYLRMRVRNNIYKDRPTVITIEYTKTTDQATIQTAAAMPSDLNVEPAAASAGEMI